MLWLKFLLPALLGLVVLIPSQGQGVSATPDSLGMLESQVKRIGIYTYTGSNFLSGNYQTDSQRTALRFSHNWIYNSTASVKGFIRNDYLARFQQASRIGKSDFWGGQQIDYSEYQANHTSILRLLQEYSFQIQPDSNWKVSSRAFGGIRRDERFGRADFGPEVGGAAQVHLLPNRNKGTGGAAILVNHAQVGPRQFRRFQTDVFYASPEELPATVAARAGYYKVNSADYLSGNVQNIISDTIFGDLQIGYRISKDVFFRSVTMAALPQRQFVYRQQTGGTAEQQNFGYNQTQLETTNRIRYNRNKLDATVEFVYRERNRIYKLQNNRRLSGPELRNAEERERTKDIREKHYIWGWDVLWRFNRMHALQAQTTAQLLRLDTPSKLNSQDRDEVYYIGKLSLESRWSQGFRTTFGIAAEDKQFVYLTAQQSIENYHEHIVRWEPGFVWQQGRFSWNATMQLWATYHVRDAAAEQVKNRSNRTYMQTHAVALELPLFYRLQLQYTRRENRTGLLNWQQFSESPLDTITSHDVSLSLEKKFRKENKQTVMRAGYRLFQQGQHRVAGRQNPAGGMNTIYMRDITRQHGPEVTFLHSQTGYLEISATVWLQILNTFTRYKQSNEPYLGAVVSEQQLSQKLHAVYPYFSCSVSWYLGRFLKKSK